MASDHIHIEYMALSALRKHPRNPKDHDIGKLHMSINRFGFIAPILIDERTGFLVAGHGRLDTLVQMKAANTQPPSRIEARAEDWYIPVVRGIAFNSDAEIEAYLVADNQLTIAGGWHEAELAALLQELQAQDDSLLNATGFDSNDLEALLQQISDLTAAEQADAEAADQSDKPRSDGSLLALAQVTIDEPKHQVERGDVWQLGKHLLICADVLSEWKQWIGFLKGSDTLFAPYPGPFVPLSEKAEQVKIVMVQPDPYVAGHILDRYSEVKGEADVVKRT